MMDRFGFCRVLDPGDVVLYRGQGVVGRLISIKTWSPYTHCEMYLGQELSTASRDGIGVGVYPTRVQDAAVILRAVRPFDLQAARAFAEKCCGQRYDWFGLFRFFTVGVQSKDKQFCSEFLTRVLRAGGCNPFADDYDADLVSPGMLAASPEFGHIYI